MERVFVGYTTYSPAYLVYSPQMQRTYERRYSDVEFDEDSRVPEREEEMNDEDVKQLKAFFEKLASPPHTPHPA